MSENDDIVKEFLIESHENLDRLDRDLVALEKNPSDREILASIFRTIHTIKGTSGFLAFGKLEAVAHVGESLLAKLRDGQLNLNPEITTALLAMVDAVRQMLNSIEAIGNEGQRDDDILIARLTGLLRPQEPGTAPGPPLPKPGAPREPITITPVIEMGMRITEAAPTEQPATAAEAASTAQSAPPPELPQPEHQNIGDILIERGEATSAEVAKAAQAQIGGDPRHLGEILVDQGATKPHEVLEALQTQQAKGQAASERTIRVDVGLLDQLMNLVGELVLARNQILQSTKNTEETNLVTAGQRLNLIASELQESVMKTRMQPIGNIWSRFPRTVRDVALSCGKKVRIQMEGQETELDKTLIEAIKDPLTHLVRNAVDHGVESPEARKAAGKDPEGVLLLRAFHEGGKVNIEISDDGAGLNIQRVVGKAVQKGLITADQASRLSEREAANLIFLPGLSTAEKVTNVSGRGVGMDVVKTNIERIGGSVDLQSSPGKGTTVKVKIPLTLAIVPALIVTSGGQCFAIPQVSLLELVGLEGEEARKNVEWIKGSPVYRLRGNLLPLVDLNQALGQRDARRSQESWENASQGLDFADSRSKHGQWLEKLRQMLNGKTKMTVEEAGSHEHCALGKWLYGDCLQRYGSFQETQLLETAHREFHELVHDVVRHKLGGEIGKAQEAFGRIGPLTRRVVELLSAVENRGKEQSSVKIVVLRAEDRQFGLVVDEINNTEEIVVKPLSKHLKNTRIYAGSTIMGDGKVALILDVMNLAQSSHVLTEGQTRKRAEQEQVAVAGGDQKQRLVLFAGSGSRFAVPLDMLARLENIPGELVERSGKNWVTQYRGQILQLIRISHVLDGGGQYEEESQLTLPTKGMLQVLVLESGGKAFGLVVNQILDIVDSTLEPKSPPTRPGVLFSAIVADRVTEILDVPAVLSAGEMN